MGASTRKLFRWAVVLGSAFVVAACASEPDAPRWVGGKPPKDYSADQYAWGVGSDARAEAAATKAVAEVARKTSGESEGAQVERTWIDEDRKVHWALAVLDRPAQVERLEGEWVAADAQLAATLASAEKDALPSRAFVDVLRAIELAATRDALAARIGRLGGTRPSIDPARDRARLDEQLASLKHSLTIDVEASEMDSKTGMVGDPLEEVRLALSQEVIARGFRIGSPGDWTPSSGWLLIRARVGIEPLDLGSAERFVAVEWNAAVEIDDRTGDGEVLAIKTRKGRTTHLNEQEARREARKQAEAFLVEALADWMDERTTPRS